MKFTALAALVSSFLALSTAWADKPKSLDDLIQNALESSEAGGTASAVNALKELVRAGYSVADFQSVYNDDLPANGWYGGYGATILLQKPVKIGGKDRVLKAKAYLRGAYYDSKDPMGEVDYTVHKYQLNLDEMPLVEY